MKTGDLSILEPFTFLKECLNIFGGNSSSSTAFELCFAGKGNPLVLLLVSFFYLKHISKSRWTTLTCYSRLEESGVLTNCSIKTLEAEESLNFDFDNSNILNKLIIRVGRLFCWWFKLTWDFDSIDTFCSCSLNVWRKSLQNLIHPAMSWK